MNNLLKIVLLGVVLLAIGGAYYLGTNQTTTPIASDGSSATDTAAPVSEPAEPKPLVNPFSVVMPVTVYDGISVSANTTELDLSDRGLTGSLKAEVRELTQLRVLDLSGNDFTGLPAEVGQLSQLEILNLSGNPLTGLPLELGNLQNLQVLDLSDTKYSEIDLKQIKAALPDTVEIKT